MTLRRAAAERWFKGTLGCLFCAAFAVRAWQAGAIFCLLVCGAYWHCGWRKIQQSAVIQTASHRLSRLASTCGIAPCRSWAKAETSALGNRKNAAVYESNGEAFEV